MMSNRIIHVPRESIHPSIEGVDFGGPTWVMARSPRAVLLWVGSHSWSLNGHQRYAAAEMVLLPNRQGHRQGRLVYRRLHEGGRLSQAVLSKTYDPVAEAFDEEVPAALLWALRASPRQTVLVEGGGPRLMPSRMGGQAEYEAWRDLPERDRGFTSLP